MLTTSHSSPSTVAPSDSASATGKKPRLGKSERAARRSAVGSTPGQSASAAKALTFASGGAVPKPQPGRHPIVFQTGAGEPSRDQLFAVDERVLHDSLASFPPRFTFNAKYAEFKAHADLEDSEFSRDITVSALLRLAQQVVHSHVNLGLPQGDFSAVASTDVRVPASVSAYLSQFGEHTVPALGTRFLFSDYDNTVRSLVWTAYQVSRNGSVSASLKRSWLPARPRDGHTRTIIASRLAAFLANADVSVKAEVLEGALLSGQIPDAWEGIKPLIGDDEHSRNRFDFLFQAYSEAAQFVVAFTTAGATAVLSELDLAWANPSAGHVDWVFNVKELFTRLSDSWARKSATYALFFEMSSGLVNRHAATGSQSQMVQVTTSEGVTILKAHLALSAPEFSSAACFPATAVYTGSLVRRVVMTTPLSVTQRATEFVQMDWR
nr:coat protein [Ustilaginoidea virens partitivirus]